jgi:hypothetical protein
MAGAGLDCDLADTADLERAYLHGSLAEADADAFEAHYFACDRCWASLQRAIEQRAAFSGMAETPAARPTAGRRLSLRPGWPLAGWPLAVAASIVLVVAAGWRLTSALGRQHSPDDAERGAPTTGLAVRAIAGSGTLGVAWRPVQGAQRYRVRLFAPDGTLLAERTVTDTTLAIPRDSLSARAPGGAAYWSVDALDATRQSLARSPLVAATLDSVR